MEKQDFKFIDHTGAEFVDRLTLGQKRHDFIPAVVIKSEQINAEIERLASLPTPANGRRVSIIANPATGIGDGLAHSIGVSLNVLKPGERTRPMRQNAATVDFCIRGKGSVKCGKEKFEYSQYDVMTTPPWTISEHANESDELQVRLTYSNSPLLEKLGVFVADDNPPPTETALTESEDLPDPRRVSPFGTFQLTEQGAWLMPYEKLINPDFIGVQPLHWSWEKVKNELDKLRALGQEYVGRRLYLMYDPATGRTNGTTHTFFATITVRPANIVDRPHRHISAAINYYFSGSGYSMVEGQRYEWEAGDLMLSAPGWAVHNHASKNEDVYELTIQDQPLHLALGSLLWHENLKHDVKLLGMSDGFLTNRTGGGK